MRYCLLAVRKITCDSLRGGQIGLFYSFLCLPAALSTAQSLKKWPWKVLAEDVVCCCFLHEWLQHMLHITVGCTVTPSLDQSRWGFNENTALMTAGISGSRATSWDKGDILVQDTSCAPGSEDQVHLDPNLCYDIHGGNTRGWVGWEAMIYLLQLNLTSVAKCRCCLHYMENEEKSAGRWKSESQNPFWKNLKESDQR